MSKNVLILLNDGDQLLARVAKRKFETQGGWNVMMTTSYEEALESLKKESPGLIMTEIMLGGDSDMTGFDLIKEARSIEKLADSTVVVFSELSQQEDKDKAMKLGADYYYVKSEVSVKDIVEEIKEIVEKKD